MSEHYRSIPLTLLEADPHQPRIELESTNDPALTEARTLEGLAQSIREVGVLQPIRVRHHDTQADRYQIISGQRRFEAAKLVGLTEIPCIVDDTPRDQATLLLTQVSENLQRKAFTTNELALAIASLKQGGASREAIAQKLGIQPSQVTLLLSLLTLKPPVKEAFNRGRIESPRAAYDLNKLPDDVQHLLIRDSESRNRIITQRDVREVRSNLRARDPVQHDRYEAPSLAPDELADLRATLEDDGRDQYVPDTDKDAVFGAQWRRIEEAAHHELQYGIPAPPAQVRLPCIQLTLTQARRLLTWIESQVPVGEASPSQETDPVQLARTISTLLSQI